LITPYDIATDSNDNVVVAGGFTGNVNFGGGWIESNDISSDGSYDAFVVKLAPNGNHIWSITSGNSGEQWATAVAVDIADNVVLFGQLHGTVNFGGSLLSYYGSNPAYDHFVAKLDPTSGHIWSQVLAQPANGNVVADVVTDGAGNIVVAGRVCEVTKFAP
jgi:hypothetical protein